ncbi:CFI-box-CTERM domain-containing protein [Ottowia sp.]|jgi:hypothetical protein|uniref:CFI-box-CTERM domain-containing protein n=1 Tax=Ottowia sp. TaxID=1898956 RepID=UPI002619DFCC|nr:CFI-box-CTERM domain-containing protein [Ottowia sp.]
MKGPAPSIPLRRDSVSASELAQLGVCEQLVQFEHLYGQRRSAGQLADMERGIREHRRFLQEGGPERKGRCFIATLVYGEGREVALLRSFRDRVLRPSMLGRGLILAYYRISPTVCRFLNGRPLLLRTMRMALRPTVWIAGRVLARGGRRNV